MTASPDTVSWAAGSSLSALLPSAAAAMGAPDAANLLGLPASDRICVILVDGLGLAALKRKAGHAPFLSKVLSQGLAGGTSRRLFSAFPSTTAASLASLGTGLPPGQHGLVGYDVLDPAQDKVVNLLGGWDAKVDPASWQPFPTVFEQLRGFADAVTVSLPRFETSALTRAALRGSRFIGGNTGFARTAAAASAMHAARESGTPTLLYLYWPELDVAGHRDGLDSPRWEYELEELDGAVRRLVAQLPPETLLLLSADHGMIDVPARQRIDYSASPELIAGVRHTAGEPRLVQLHLEPGADQDRVAEAWRGAFGSKIRVLSRQQVVAAGWFGPVRAEVVPRIGDLLIAAQEPLALYDVRRVGERPLEVVGQHGSTTRAEREVPLLQIPLPESVPGGAGQSRAKRKGTRTQGFGRTSGRG
ncbi:alkaline phosphatase family protein [Acaricomes phytoseiuli]|uniref:alkaline phosphatase family protein n=1 Tax=Acaricomes phytoseiuli TaxID=291968 RepID=UPI002222935C|nr:nucleotide pyrophosphatase/phosphodiesterase family protein [Acaricomes phytoseiuli]MCW1249121.1 alkaline phosphatase family protein [Acaricomes phytoseiuli]